MRGIFELVQQQLQSFDIEWSDPEESRLDAILSPNGLVNVVQILKGMDLFYLVAITGLDAGTEANVLEILYHFCARSYVLTLRVQIARNQPELNSICSIFPYASPLERETGEMFGIRFINTPDTSRLFLPEDWDESVYPLRKDVDLGEVDDVNN